MDNQLKDQKKTEDHHCQSQDCCIEEIGIMVQRLVRVMQLFERDQIKPYGFTTSQCYVLIELKKSTQMTMNELSDKMNVNTSTMTRSINNLVRDGLIERSRDEGDRRIVMIQLTDEGVEAATKLELSIMNYYKKIVTNLPSGQVEDVLKAVSLLIDAFDQANPNCC